MIQSENIKSSIREKILFKKSRSFQKNITTNKIKEQTRINKIDDDNFPKPSKNGKKVFRKVKYVVCRSARGDMFGENISKNYLLFSYPTNYSIKIKKRKKKETLFGILFKGNKKGDDNKHRRRRIRKRTTMIDLNRLSTSPNSLIGANITKPRNSISISLAAKISLMVKRQNTEIEKRRLNKIAEKQNESFLKENQKRGQKNTVLKKNSRVISNKFALRKYQTSVNKKKIRKSPFRSREKISDRKNPKSFMFKLPVIQKSQENDKSKQKKKIKAKFDYNNLLARRLQTLRKKKERKNRSFRVSPIKSRRASNRRDSSLREELRQNLEETSIPSRFFKEREKKKGDKGKEEVKKKKRILDLRRKRYKVRSKIECSPPFGLYVERGYKPVMNSPKSKYIRSFVYDG